MAFCCGTTFDVVGLEDDHGLHHLKPGGDLERDYEQGRLVLARQNVDELPVHLVEASGGDWWEVLDSIDGDLESLSTWVENVPAEEEEYALKDGSLFYFRKLDVHSRLRGQSLSVRLMAHAL